MFRDLILDDHVADTPATPPVAEPPAPVDITKINTLHELLAVAMRDFRQVLEDPRYLVDMRAWHTPVGKNACQVCLAGSVLAKRLHTPLHTYAYEIGMRREPYWRHMKALNNLRRGQVGHALSDLEGTPYIGAHALDRRNPHWDAVGKIEGQRLLAELHDLHRDLVAAGI